MNDIVVEVRGGVVVEVYTSVRGARVLIVDWDDLEGADQSEVAAAVHAHCEISQLPADTRECYQRALRDSSGEEAETCTS